MALRDDSSDSIAFVNDVQSLMGGGVSSALTSIVLSAGTTIDLSSPSGPTSTWVGTTTNTVLTGSNFGPNVFDLGPGGDTVNFGTGSNGGSSQNTVHFGKGDGTVMVNVDAASGALILGAGITVSDVAFKFDGIGGLIVGLADDPADSITFKGDLTEPLGSLNSYLDQVVFANGTTLTGAQVLASPTLDTVTADTLIGTSSADLLDGFGAPPGLQDYAQGNGGADTFVFKAGYGHLEVNENAGYYTDSTATLQLGAGINAANLGISKTTVGDLLLTDGVAGDQVKLDGMVAPTYGKLHPVWRGPDQVRRRHRANPPAACKPDDDGHGRR